MAIWCLLNPLPEIILWLWQNGERKTRSVPQIGISQKFLLLPATNGYPFASPAKNRWYKAKMEESHIGQDFFLHWQFDFINP